MLKDWETKRQRNEMFMNRLENIKIEKRDIHEQIGKHKDRKRDVHKRCGSVKIEKRDAC